MAFSPDNPIVKLCLQGMGLEINNDPEGAARVFLQAWNEAGNDFEKYLAAFYLSRHQKNVTDKLKWLEITLEHALKVNDDSVQAAFYPLYSSIAVCYESLGEMEKAKQNLKLAGAFVNRRPTDKGPFYHGTKADLNAGDHLKAGFNSNYKTDLTMKHIYFTALINGAGLAAGLAKGDGPERVYVVQPTGDFEDDPNVTNKKFPGNPTRSYRTSEPLTIIGEVDNWQRQTPEDLQKWKERLDKNKGEIIN